MRILIAEDGLDISTLYKRALEARKHSIVLTYTGKACLQNYLDTFHNSNSNNSNVKTPTHKSNLAIQTTIARTKGTSISTSKNINPGPDVDSKNVIPPSLYDVVILDYKMLGKNCMDVAKEILAVNPHQRIIFASAYVKEALQESVKQLKQVVELMQKPLSISQLADTIEDRQAYEELKRLNIDVNRIKAAEPSHELIIDLLERLKRIQKYRTF